MKWHEIKDGDGYCRLSIEADWSELAADYEDIVAGYPTVRLPGFRPGKVPRAVMERMFSREIMDDLSRRVGRRLGREALREAGAEPLGPIEIGGFECGKEQPFRFTVRFRPMTEIEMPDIGSLAIQDDGTNPRDLISHRLLEMASFTVPDELVRAELGSDDGDSSKESIAWKAATDRVRLLLVLKRIAAREGIEVTEADIERRIQEKAVEFGTNPDTLRTEFRNGGARQRLKDMLLAESTLDYLVEKATHRWCQKFYENRRGKY